MEMQVLILKNVPTEGPGTMVEYLEGALIPFLEVELSGAEPVPTTGEYDALVVLGGPMGVYDAAAHPNVGPALGAIREALDAGRRVLGVCLGAQMMAHVLGAEVFKGPAEELGWHPVELTQAGREDRAMAALREGMGGGPMTVFHWHGDTYDLPAGAVRLAGSDMYEQQAFRMGDGAYALQFHIEATPTMVASWMRGLEAAGPVNEDTLKYHARCREGAMRFYSEFFGQS